jgi:hypothetical protein
VARTVNYKAWWLLIRMAAGMGLAFREAKSHSIDRVDLRPQHHVRGGRGLIRPTNLHASQREPTVSSGAVMGAASGLEAKDGKTCRHRLHWAWID